MFIAALAPRLVAGLWRYQTGSRVESSPTVSGGTVYVGSYDRYLYAVNATSGALRWRYLTGSGVSSSPTVSGGTVYVGSWDNNLNAVNATSGALRWQIGRASGRERV